MTDNWMNELYESYEEVLEPWQIKLAFGRLKAFRIPHYVWQDAMQELAMDIVNFEFDPAKAGAASEETILCRLLDNRIRMMARTHARRLSFHRRLSRMRQEVLDTDTPYKQAVEKQMREAIAEFTPLQQKICEGLIHGDTTAKIAEDNGHCPMTIRVQIQAIRRALVRMGFDGAVIE